MQMPNRPAERVDGYMGGMNEQAIINNIQTSAGPPQPAQGAFPICPQCGVMHPPLPPGKKCSVAKVELKESGVSKDDIVRFTVNLRDIAISQIEKKNIKEGNKLFKYLTIEFMKLLEEYEEE
jgi:hypothetical protein